MPKTKRAKASPNLSQCCSDVGCETGTAARLARVKYVVTYETAYDYRQGHAAFRTKEELEKFLDYRTVGVTSVRVFEVSGEYEVLIESSYELKKLRYRKGGKR